VSAQSWVALFARIDHASSWHVGVFFGGISTASLRGWAWFAVAGKNS
jgi:hypothetical protein